VLVREETNPEDIEGMKAAEAILNCSRREMTSHAALVARGWGKMLHPFGAGAMEVDHDSKTFRVGETVIKEGDWISLNGTKVYI